VGLDLDPRGERQWVGEIGSPALEIDRDIDTEKSEMTERPSLFVCKIVRLSSARQARSAQQSVLTTEPEVRETHTHHRHSLRRA
jgi:hypothetical protein